MTPHRPLEFVRTSAGCFECVSHSGSRGRGHGLTCRPQIRVGGKVIYVYRAVYEWLKGTIPAGLVLDHRCQNPCCCEPTHLEPVQNAVNVRRAHNGTKDDNGNCRIHGAEFIRKAPSWRAARCSACTALRRRKTGPAARHRRRSLILPTASNDPAFNAAGRQ